MQRSCIERKILLPRRKQTSDFFFLQRTSRRVYKWQWFHKIYSSNTAYINILLTIMQFGYQFRSRTWPSSGPYNEILWADLICIYGYKIHMLTSLVSYFMGFKVDICTEFCKFALEVLVKIDVCSLTGTYNFDRGHPVVIFKWQYFIQYIRLTQLT